MTLSTDIYILDKIDPGAVFAFCRDMLLEDSEAQHRAYAIPIEHSDSWDGKHKVTMHPPGVGLNAWLMVHHNHQWPVQKEPESHNEDCEDDCEGLVHDPAHFLRIDLDTAYSFRHRSGGGAAALHAQYIVTIGKWLDDQGIAWGWQNEFTFEKWFGEDRYTKLGEFMGDGDDAEKWFREIVAPTIMQEHLGTEA